MGSPKLYYIEVSPASRAVILTARALKINLDLIPINTLAGEHLTPQFVAINPQHCVPTLVDVDGFTVWDSHAICTYLAAAYASDQSILTDPSAMDAKQRAQLDQRLHYHHGTLFQRYYAVIAPVFGQKATEFGSPAQLDAIHVALAFLETFLGDGGYVLGTRRSVADILCLTTVSSIETVLQIELSKYPLIGAWQKRMASELPGFAEIETKGVTAMRALLVKRVAENKALHAIDQVE